jgi:hypothetical protein
LKHPCKKCLVRAACSKECDIWKTFIDNAARLIALISIMLSAIIVGALLIWLRNIVDTTSEEWPKMVIVLMWIFSFSITTLLQAPLDEDEKVGFFGTFIFAPFILFFTVIIHSTKNYFRRP